MPEPDRAADILVVDDDPSVRACLARMLESHGHAVATVPDGRAALHFLCEQRPPRLIVLDLAMPGVAGREFLLARRCHPVMRTVPVVVFSGAVALGGTDPLALGAQAVLGKPEGLRDVIEAARFYCQGGAPAA